jgi:NAD(P)-dependent dehydrogenase (short-subunit alcohol dehydrogenase family)
VTGAASGIGAAIVGLLLADGVHVVAADIVTESLEALASATSRALTVTQTDITDEGSVSQTIETALNVHGRIDQLFNVAGGAKFGTILDGHNADWTDTVALGLTGTYLMTRYAATAMRSNRSGGAIVNVASLNAHVPMAGGSAYSAAKAGTENFTKSSALELAQYKIRVNAVLPGLVDTPLTAQMLLNADLKDDYLARIPLGAPATASEIAHPCVFLASDGAAYVTGTSLVVDGGWEITNYPVLSRYL